MLELEKVILIDKNIKQLSLQEFVKYWSPIYRELNTKSYPDDVYDYFLINKYSEFNREKLIWMGAWKWDMIKSKSPTLESGVLEQYEFKKGWKQKAKKEYPIYKHADIQLLKDINSMSVQSNRLTETSKAFESISKKHRVGMVNAVFLLHIADRLQYPIYDQFVHRALDYLSGGVSIKFIRSRKAHEQTTYKHIYEYMHGYKAFFDHLSTKIDQIRIEESEKLSCKRDLDKALWAFGRWLRKS
jgi:hypothetical protein